MYSVGFSSARRQSRELINETEREGNLGLASTNRSISSTDQPANLLQCFRQSNVASLQENLVGLDKFPPFARVHEHAQATDRLAPDPGGEVLRPKLVCTRGRPSGLPHRLASHPLTGSRSKLLLIGDSRGRPADPQTLIQFLGGFLARRERCPVG